MSESPEWIATFLERDARKLATAEDYRRTAEHIRATCEEIRQGWSAEEEIYRRTSVRARKLLSFTVPIVAVADIVAAN